MLQKLYTNKHNIRAKRILVAAQYASVKLDVVEFNPETTGKNAEFLAKFPLGKAPALEAADGTLLFDADAIAHFGKFCFIYILKKKKACQVGVCPHSLNLRKSKKKKKKKKDYLIKRKINMMIKSLKNYTVIPVLRNICG